MTGRHGKKPALVVAGPTCSGKSAMALDLARLVGGTIINADSMQVYRELRVLTARPTAAEMAEVPHALYGVRPAATPSTAAWWRAAALAEMEQAHAAGRVPILCGGTGLYLAALSQGLADIPDPGPQARAQARLLLAEDGAAALHARLAEADPDTAATLRPTDGQRLARAWEVWLGTGAGLAAWHARQVPLDFGWELRAIVLDPPREDLRDAIAGRFAAMLRQGALEEVSALLTQRLDTALPAMRAHGVPELSAHLRGELGLDEAGRRAIAATGRYTKRQATWFRHHDVASGSNAAALLTHRFLARYLDLTQLTQSLSRDLRLFCSS